MPRIEHDEFMQQLEEQLKRPEYSLCAEVWSRQDEHDKEVFCMTAQHEGCETGAQAVECIADSLNPFLVALESVVFPSQSSA